MAFGYWRGSFQLPGGKHANAAGEDYHLEIDDERVRLILWRRYSGRLKETGLGDEHQGHPK